jgi:fructose-specific phosphotransferase system IIA component
MDMKIATILDPACIRLNMEASNKADALGKMVDLLASGGKVLDKVKLSSVIHEREKLMSTGIGNAVALPHGKTDAVDRSMIAVATLQNPIDFDSLDDNPVQIVILLVGTEANVGLHLRLLSRISRMVGSEQFRASLLHAKSVDDVMMLFASQEEDRA